MPQFFRILRRGSTVGEYIRAFADTSYSTIFMFFSQQFEAPHCLTTKVFFVAECIPREVSAKIQVRPGSSSIQHPVTRSPPLRFAFLVHSYLLAIAVDAKEGSRGLLGNFSCTHTDIIESLIVIMREQDLWGFNGGWCGAVHRYLSLQKFLLSPQLYITESTRALPERVLPSPTKNAPSS